MSVVDVIGICCQLPSDPFRCLPGCCVRAALQNVAHCYGQEHTPENLRFVVWYQDYRHRFFALPPDVRSLSPGPAAHHFDFGLPSPARIARRDCRERFSFSICQSKYGRPDRASRPHSQAYSIPTEDVHTVSDSIDHPLSGVPLTPTSAAPLLSSSLRAMSTTPGLHYPRCSHLSTDFCPPSLSQQSAHSGTSLLTPPTSLCLSPAAPTLQPFRHEITAVAHTFLLPGSPQELSLPALLRTRVQCHLAQNTHPDALLPAYEVAFDTLRGTSLPRWLKLQEENIGWEKKVYWWAYGAFTTLLGWVVVWACVFSHGVRREWRLWAVPLLCLGGMQMYAGYRGCAVCFIFCSCY